MTRSKITDTWKKSYSVPIYNKNDVQNYGIYKGIKFMSHTIKMWEKIIKKTLKEETIGSKN